MLDLKKVRKILVIKLRYIGDVLLSTPVIESLKRERPDVSIAVLVNEGTEPVLYNNPYLDGVFVVNPRSRWKKQLDLIRILRSWDFDLAIDLTDGDRSAILGFLSGADYRVGFNHERRWRGLLYHQIVKADRHKMHAVDYHLEVLKTIGCKDSHEGPALYPSPVDGYVIEQLLKEKGSSSDLPFVVIHPGARWWFKSWPIDRFIELAKRLHKELGYRVVVVGGDSDIEAAGKITSGCGDWAISVAGQITLLQLAALLQQAALFVGNDAGPMHMAAALRTPVVALFGPTDPRVWGPWGVGHQVIYKHMDCAPCWRSDCQRGELNCMRQIRVDEVWRAVQKVMTGKGAHA